MNVLHFYSPSYYCVEFRYTTVGCGDCHSGRTARSCGASDHFKTRLPAAGVEDGLHASWTAFQRSVAETR